MVSAGYFLSNFHYKNEPNFSFLKSKRRSLLRRTLGLLYKEEEDPVKIIFTGIQIFQKLFELRNDVMVIFISWSNSFQFNLKKHRFSKSRADFAEFLPIETGSRLEIYFTRVWFSGFLLFSFLIVFSMHRLYLSLNWMSFDLMHLSLRSLVW